MSVLECGLSVHAFSITKDKVSLFHLPASGMTKIYALFNSSFHHAKTLSFGKGWGGERRLAGQEQFLKTCCPQNGRDHVPFSDGATNVKSLWPTDLR